MKSPAHYRNIFRFPQKGEIQQISGDASLQVNLDDLYHNNHADRFFLFIFLVLFAYGFIMLFSASFGESFVNSAHEVAFSKDSGLNDALPEAMRTKTFASASFEAKQQLFLSGVSLIIALVFAGTVKFSSLLRSNLYYIVYLFFLMLLVATYFFGDIYNGAKRWLDIGISLQTSEFAKIGIIYVLGIYFYRRQKERERNASVKRAFWDHRKQGFWRRHLGETYKDFLKPAFMVLLYIMFVVIQPHVSGAIIISLASLLMFILGGIPKQSWVKGIITLLCLLCVLLLIFYLAAPLILGQTASSYVEENFAHVFKRVNMYNDIGSVSEGTAVQIVQARIAFGSGGITGRGLGRSVQKLNWLPEGHNDYIFAIIGEELGFVGCLSIILLFLLFLIAGLRIASQGVNYAARNLVLGYTFLIVVQAFLNMAVSLAILPSTGISLPYFSSGGSANLVFCLAAGMILLISKRGVYIDPVLARAISSRSRRRAK